jgi:hypothetical protein
MGGIVRRWSRPSIVVLSRSTSAEGVLSPCKSCDPSVGSNTVYGACWEDSPNCYNACHMHEDS